MGSTRKCFLLKKNFICNKKWFSDFPDQRLTGGGKMKNKGGSIRKVFCKVFADIFQAEKAATILILVLLAGGTLHNYLLVEFVDGIISEISEISDTTTVRNTLLMEICVFLLAILISAAIMQ